MGQEFEQIDHSVVKNFKLFLVNMDYRPPHMHRDFEICLILDGSVKITSREKSYLYEKNDYFIFNPFQPHELTAIKPALILSIQIQTNFCKDYFPAIRSMEFAFGNFMSSITPEERMRFLNISISLAHHYLLMEKGFELICVSEVNQLLYELLKTYPYTQIKESERNKRRELQERMQRVMEYIDTHYTDRLYLSDIAEQEQLTMTYLSHFFKDNFQISFQDYVNSLRCEKARQLLLLTDLNLIDISMDCGFSDIKYFHKGFLRQYGCTPREFRKNFDRSSLPEQQRSILSTQEFLSNQSSLVLLDQFSSV